MTGDNEPRLWLGTWTDHDGTPHSLALWGYDEGPRGYLSVVVPMEHGPTSVLRRQITGLRPAVVAPELMTAEEQEKQERSVKAAIANAFEAEAEPWRLSTDSGDRLAWIAARVAVAAMRAMRGRWSA